MVSTVLALRTTTYLKKERDYMPWQSAINNLDFFYLMFDRSEVYGPLQVNPHSAPPGALGPLPLSTTAHSVSVFLLDLPQATGGTFVPVLQRRN